MARSPTVRLGLGLSLAALVLGLDQISKWMIVERLFRPEGIATTPFITAERIPLTPFFNLVMVWNRGVSFGMFNQAGPWNAIVLSGLALVVVGFLVHWMRKARSLWVEIALGLVAGGALGNVIDRARVGAVADFLDVHVGNWHWPAFNLADSAITVGALLLVLDSLFGRRTTSKELGS